MSVQRLHTLQELDLSIARQRREAADVEAESKDRSALLALEQAVQSHQGRLEELRATQRDRELEAGQFQARIRDMDGQMYSGRVKNPRELEGMNTDVQHLRGRLGSLEEGLLEVMLQGDEATQSLTEAEEALGQEQARRAQREESLKQRFREITSELDDLENRRRLLVNEVPQQELRLYEQLCTTRNGQAVARVEAGRCRGCNMAIPTHEFQQARSGRALVQCGNCGRILFVG